MSEPEDFAVDLYDGYGPGPGPAAPGPGTAGPDAMPEPVFASLERFVEDYLLKLYRRAVSGHQRTWCAQWWCHPEAWVRLDALWRSWEFLRLDPGTGMSVWLRDHADPHMTMLLSAEGPFRNCKPDAHAGRPLERLPSAPIPEDAEDPTRPAREGL